MDFHEDLLLTDLEVFNEKLIDWLVKYNGIQPHKGLGLQTPMQYIIKHNKKCNLWRTHTNPPSWPGVVVHSAVKSAGFKSPSSSLTAQSSDVAPPSASDASHNRVASCGTVSSP